MTIKDKLVNYCNQQGIKIKFASVKNGFMPQLCRINKGSFIIDPSVDWTDEMAVSLILHELGHLFSVPKENRAKLTAYLRGVDQKYICEYAARLLSYNLCLKLDIPLEYCLAFFASEPDKRDRDHTLQTFYLQAYNWYYKDKRKFKKEAIIDVE
jgi:hypothetical protein